MVEFRNYFSNFMILNVAVSTALEGLTAEEGPEFQEFHKSLG